MEYRYVLELSDFKQVNKFLVARDPRLKRTIWVRSLILPGLLGFDLYFLHLPTWMYASIIAAVLVGWILLMKWTTIRVLKRSALAYQGVTIMAITPEFMSVEHAWFEMRVKWEKFSDILASNKHLIFRMSNMGYYVIPISVFPDAEHAHAFLETAKAYQAGTLAADVAAPNTAAWPPAPRRMEQ